MWNDFISQHMHYNALLYRKNRAINPIVLFAEGICMDEYNSRFFRLCSNLGGGFESFTAGIIIQRKPQNIYESRETMHNVLQIKS